MARAASIPHEETLAGPKADRLKLFHATDMNLSPIFGLYPDPEGLVQAELDRAVGRALPLEAHDHLGVISKLWPVSDQHAVSAVTGLMGPKPIFIADGHHRYETGLRYLEDKTQAGEVRDAEAPANFILMMLVSMSDPGLVILPTHRLVSGVGDLTVDQLKTRLKDHFQFEAVRDAREAWELIEADGGQKLLGFGTVADGQWLIGRYIGPDKVMAELAASHSADWRGLAVSLLHVLVLGKLLPGQPHCRYVHLTSEVLDAVAQQSCQLAVLVPPASMRHVEQIAGNLEKMPPKSTYFYPKLLSGLVFNSLKVH